MPKPSKLLLIHLLWVNLLVGAGAVRGAEEQEENWSLHAQATQVFQRKPDFAAAYTGPNSLIPDYEQSRTTTATIFLGLRPWQGGEIYFNPEMAIGIPFSGLKGLGGFTNGEIARTSGPDPVFYRARLFYRHTWGLGSETEYQEADQNQLAGRVSRERLVLTAGNVSALDIFDENQYSHEPRRAFMNWSLMTHGAWDYPADARGFTWGAALEYIAPDWAVRGGRFMMPRESNGLKLNTQIMDSFGDVVEFERAYHLGSSGGRVRLMAFRNRAKMGSFGDALAIADATGTTPDLTATRQERDKVGFGVNVEHDLSEDIGFFARASRNDGKSETFAFTEIDQSAGGGLVFKGKKWSRPGDEVGVAFVVNGLSNTHRDYLARGGLGFFLGDGRLNYGAEQILETYYSAKAGKYVWISLDLQYIRRPGYNEDRGPAHFYGLRLHAEI